MSSSFVITKSNKILCVADTLDHAKQAGYDYLESINVQLVTRWREITDKSNNSADYVLTFSYMAPGSTIRETDWHYLHIKQAAKWVPKLVTRG